MEALILSCSTGGGHNTAAQAVFEALTERGHHAVRMDPYTLVSEELANKVGQTYIKLVQKSPKLFGAVYDLGNAYRMLPGRSPVYHINGKMAPYMQKYLAEHLTDVIVCTHLYPAEILTHMRLNGMETPPFVFIATDYTCIPFTEESDCDLYVTPSPLLSSDFTGRGIPAEKLRPLGIPVRLDFSDDTITKDRAREALNLPKDRRTLLLSGGSMGAGSIINAVRALLPYLKQNADCDLNILCGSNEALFDSVEAEFAKNGANHANAQHEQNGTVFKGKRRIYLEAGRTFIYGERRGGRAACAHFADTRVRKPQRGVFCQGGYRRKGGKHRNRAFVGGGKAFGAGKCRRNAQTTESSYQSKCSHRYLRAVGNGSTVMTQNVG